MAETGDYFDSMPFPQTEDLPPPKPQPKTLLDEMFTYDKDVSYEITPENAILDKEIFPFSHDGSGNFARAFRQFNVIEPLYRNLVASQNWNDEEGYDPLKSRYIEQVPENHRHRFMNVGSEGELLQKLKWYRNDMEDMEMLMTGSSFYPIMTASLFSPTTFAPLAPNNILRSGNVWNRFAKGALFTSAVIAPEELLAVKELHSRDAGHAAIALAGASLIGGTLTAALGGKAYASGSRSLVLSSTDSDQIYRSAGASANPARARETARATMEGDALAETGIGIEKLGWNPTIRLLKSDNWVARKIAPQLVDIGGMIQKKIRGRTPEASDQSVETTFRTRWLPGLLKGIKEVDKQYLSYRNVVAKEGDIGRSLQMIRTSINDLVGQRGPFLSQGEFRVRVSMAMRRGDKDAVDDSVTPYVNNSARELRKHFNDIRDEAVNVRLFERQAQKVIAGLRKQISEATDPAKKTALQDQLNTALANLKRMRTHGVNVGGEYLTRIFRQDKVLANQEGFLRIAKDHFMTNEGMNATQASAAAKGVLDEVTHGKPYLDLDDASQIDWITQTGSSKARTFGIKDELIEEFLENDIEVILRHHTKTMGTDIELTRAFGDINMRSVLDDVVNEYEQIIKTGTRPDAEEMSKASTGKSIFTSVWRGSEGEGKVGFKKSAFGKGLYFAVNKGTAKLFGKTVKKEEVYFKNPFVVRSDEGLLNAMRSFGIDVSKISFKEEFGVDNLATQISKKMAKIDEMKKQAMKELKPPSVFAKEVAPIQNEIADLLKIYNKEVDKVWSEFADKVREAGYDGAIFTFGKRNYTQATSGELTFSKIMKEWQEAQSSGNPLLVRRLNHDQAIRFNTKGALDEGVPKVTDANFTRKMNDQMKADIRDIKGLRDRIRGTYGASKDPHQMSSRFVRAMKSFNILVGMGSATLSSIPDIGRVVMTEGFTNFHEKGLKHFFKKSSDIITKLSDKELRQAGIAADAILGLRASAFSDVGDLFGSRMGFERGLNKTTGMFFLANGLNYWNQTIKSFAGNVIMMRMTQDIMKPWSSLSKRQKEKFLANGIDQQSHSIMQLNIRNKGQKVDGEWMPNTELWTDRTQAMKFRKALNQSVDRTIVTPGAGDRALWTSTEIGSLITQFKGYGQGATVRVLTSGLQEKDQAFWQGAFLMVGLAYFVNEAKKIQYGIDKEDTFTESLINAIDRSGTLGWFTDVNNSLEKISDFKLGMRAILGEDVPKKMPVGQKIGAIAGPAGSNLTNIGGVAADVLSGNANQETFKSARFSTPGGNLTPADPIYDFIFGT